MTNNLTVYIVQGTTGQYEDRYTWIVNIYEDHDSAVDRVDTLNEIVNNYSPVGVDSDLLYDPRRASELEVAMKEHPMGDTSFVYDYPGLHYYIETATMFRKGNED
jgi:hypothetical protein